MDIQKVPYNELKYLVTNEQLGSVLQILQALYGASDPFECGLVDTLYYDTVDGKHLKQCLRGDCSKSKFRIRGYGDNHFNQLHHKRRHLDMVAKDKYRIRPVRWSGSRAPEWSDIVISNTADPGYARHALHISSDFLIPVIRVTYMRYRFRIKDHRLTLDTRIEVNAPANGWITHRQHGILKDHVLEIKTTESRPTLPLLGLIRLAPASFSKFKQGLTLLQPNI
jgi:hypothetical protein